MQVETTEKRINPVKKALVGTSLAVALLTGGTLTNEYVVADIAIANQKYTPHEYKQLRPAIIKRASEVIKQDGQLSYEEREMLFDVYNRENAKKKYNLDTAGGVLRGIVYAMEWRELQK